MRERRNALLYIRKILYQNCTGLKMKLRDDLLTINSKIFSWDEEAKLLLCEGENGITEIHQHYNYDLQADIDEYNRRSSTKSSLQNSNNI